MVISLDYDNDHNNCTAGVLILRLPVSQVCAGCVCGIGGLGGHILKYATLSSSPLVRPISFLTKVFDCYVVCCLRAVPLTPRKGHCARCRRCSGAQAAAAGAPGLLLPRTVAFRDVREDAAAATAGGLETAE